MPKDKIPTTPAILALKAQDADFTLHPYQYEEKGGTKVSAGKLGVDEHCVIKTLVMEDETTQPIIILMHGDKEVSSIQAIRLGGLHLSEQKKQSLFIWKSPSLICLKSLLMPAVAGCWRK
jgi:prolyl-tRNA editing enzyme YbaK/EbsC (Cys-tRNA(Pro) deacylase)